MRVVIAEDHVLLRAGLERLLDLPDTPNDHRRVLAVLTQLRG